LGEQDAINDPIEVLFLYFCDHILLGCVGTGKHIGFNRRYGVVVLTASATFSTST
jgi:hypothetical protein